MGHWQSEDQSSPQSPGKTPNSSSTRAGNIYWMMLDEWAACVAISSIINWKVARPAELVLSSGTQTAGCDIFSWAITDETNSVSKVGAVSPQKRKIIGKHLCRSIKSPKTSCSQRNILLGFLWFIWWLINTLMYYGLAQTGKKPLCRKHAPFRIEAWGGMVPSATAEERNGVTNSDDLVLQS